MTIPGTPIHEAGKRLEVRLDAKRQRGRYVEDRRGVATRADTARRRGIQATRFARGWYHREHNRGGGQALQKRGLHKKSGHRWHGLAAIHLLLAHATVMVRRAVH